MFDSILVPVDDTPGSERMVPVATALSLATGAPIVFVTVDGPNADAFEIDAYHERLTRQLPPEVSATSTFIRTEDDVAVALVDEHLARSHSLLALATRAPGTLWELLSGGSVGDAVLHAELRSVLLIGPSCDPSAAAIGISRRATAVLDGTDLDLEVTSAAIRWCEQVGCDLQFVRVVAQEEDEVLAAARASGEVWRDRADAEGVSSDLSVLVEGEPSGAILRAAEHNGGALIVGSHRRTGLDRMAHGSNALWLTHRSTVPVLVAGWPILARRPVTGDEGQHQLGGSAAAAP